MTEKLEIRVEAGQRSMEVNGRKLRFVKESMSKGGHIGTLVYQEMSDEEYDGLVSDLADKLISKSGLQLKDVMKDILQYMPVSELKKIAAETEKKPVTIEGGCLNLKVGRFEIPVGGGI
jgi:hypothetical protein